jgi:hypothetical protein
MSDTRRSVEARPAAQILHHFDDQVHKSLSARQVQKSKQSAFVQWRRVRTVSDSEEYQLTSAPFTRENWYDWLVELFRKPQAEKLAYREYEEARRSLLQCQRMRDYYDNMCRFETKRIVRLREMLQINEE